MKTHTRFKVRALALAVACILPNAEADVVTDWNVVAGDLIVESRIGTPPANRVMAIVQTAVNDALSDPELRRYASPAAVQQAAQGAAVAAANRSTLDKLLPQQQASLAKAYQAALSRLPDGPDTAAAKVAGFAAGERAAARVLAQRAGDAALGPDRYRPHTTPGAYVPTAAVAVPQWSQRQPWLLARADQFRPGPPPALSSLTWVRDYDEVKTLGARTSPQRSAEQTEIARFWEYSLPPIYHGLLRSVALAPGRSVERNAQFFATASQAMDDALIAVMDAKYHYGFWRPVTAIRNGELDGNDATVADPAWVALIDAPLHPEYPSAHSILAATLGTLIAAEVGLGRLPELATSSPTAKGATRKWASVEPFVEEVGHARIWSGIHYRSATDAGAAMGRQIGALAATQLARSAPAAVPATASLAAADGKRVP
jgi:membrane-associated phospholipid phosphatase